MQDLNKTSSGVVNAVEGSIWLKNTRHREATQHFKREQCTQCDLPPGAHTTSTTNSNICFSAECHRRLHRTTTTIQQKFFLRCGPTARMIYQLFLYTTCCFFCPHCPYHTPTSCLRNSLCSLNHPDALTEPHSHLKPLQRRVFSTTRLVTAAHFT